MDSTSFCIAVLVLSVTMASSLECSVKSQSSVLVVNCSRPTQPLMNFSTPDLKIYENMDFDRITADYQFNKLETIPKFTFAKLRSLNLANNKIKSIEDGAFSKVSLYDLDLSFNKLTSIAMGELSGLKELRSLSLYSNSITQLPPDTFKSMLLLERLDLGHNFIAGQLDPSLLQPLTKLNMLSLKENILSGADPYTFQNQKQLETLVLAANNISNLNPLTFDVVYNLKSLDLSLNKITDLDEQVFISLNDLEYLDLSWNSLEYFGAKLGLAPSLKVIKIGHNTLKDVEITGTQLKELKEIYVENNKLENLQFLTSFDKLEIVNASSNNISAIDERHYQYLHSLDLSNNSFVNIPGLITSNNLPYLSHLYFDMNPILSLKFPSSNNNFISLQLVSLSRMPLLKEVSRDSLDSLRFSEGRQKRSASIDSDYSEEEHDDKDFKHSVNESDPTKEKVEEDATENQNEALTTKENVPNEDSKSDEETATENEDSSNTPATTDDVTEKENTEHEGEVMTSLPGEERDSQVISAQREEKTAPPEEQETQDEQDGQEEQDVKDDKDKSDASKLRTAKLRVEPFLEGAERIVVDNCKIGGITLDISHNENLAKIEEESFVDIDICKLDLSYNALTTVPEKMLRWEDLPSVDFQGNPWDCSCSLQWMLEKIVPKLYPYPGKQELLYELRCASPAFLRGRRFVHFFNWTEPAFCTKHNENLRLAPTTGDDTSGVTLQLGGSTGMFIGVGIAIAMVALLVGVAAWLHRSNVMKKRARNRRV